MKGTYLKILAFAALLVGFAAFAPSDRACAGGIAPQTCDAEVWKDMAARARMESEREIMQNQNLIFKPDSILAYTCFDQMAAHAGAQAGVLFTHTDYWSPKPIEWAKTSPYLGMDKAVENTVFKAMDNYYKGNFNHSMLGGRGEKIGGPVAAMHKNGTAPTQSSVYACSLMSDVWKVAKCFNFIHIEEFRDKDGYYPFLDLKAGPGGGSNAIGYETLIDTRKYPTDCGSKPFYDITGWESIYRESRNETAFGSVDQHYQFGTPLKNTHKDVRDRIEPGKCDMPAIPTGVKVILSTGANTQPYDDGVCTNPGCTYVKSGTSGQCKKTLVGANGMVAGGV